MEGGADPQIKNHPFDAIEQVGVYHPQDNQQQKRAEDDQSGRGFGRFDLHRANKTKKPEQLKAALVCEI